MKELLASYPVVIEIPVAWGEMDVFAHVNNIVYFRYFESGRIAYFERIGYMELLKKTGLGPILAATSCKFKYPVTYPDTVSIATRVSEIQDDQFTMEYAVVSHSANRLAAEGQGRIVSYDYENNKKVPLPEKITQQILKLEKGFLQT